MDSKRLPHSEFVALMALMTALVALAIDSMLPAFPEIARNFQIQSAEKIQLIVAILFLGYGFGQLTFGPLSDVFGRKTPIYWGIAIFMIGAILSGLAPTFELFLVGRFLQGFGGAGPRIISLALVRDEYSGNAMAKTTSSIMTIFILVPTIAPSLGQGIIMFSNWRAIFITLFLLGLIGWIWFAKRQHETLPKKLRKKLTRKDISYGIRETLSQRTTIAGMLMSGSLFGVFIGYLGAIQDIFSRHFNITTTFPMFFAMLALSIGAASFSNSRVVMAMGMRRLIFFALIWMCLLSNLLPTILIFIGLTPPLWLFMSYMILTFFAIGFLFGNLNAMAMQPLGHVAGIGSAILGFVQTTISVIIGVTLGRYFHESTLPLMFSFGAVSLFCLAILAFETRTYSFKKIRRSRNEI